MTAIRVPLAKFKDCKYAANLRLASSSSVKVMALSIKIKASRAPNFWKLLSKTSTNEVFSGGNVTVSGIPVFRYSANQIFSIIPMSPTNFVSLLLLSMLHSLLYV